MGKMTQSAIIVQDKGKAILAHDVPVPSLRDGYILVKTKAVALNPTDWKHVDFVPCKGSIVGCDYAGVVEAIGPNVALPLQRGDRVAGFVHGSNITQPLGGAFAEYVIAKADLQIRLPDYMGWEAASTLGVGLVTVGQNLYQSLDLPWPDQGRVGKADESESILIYGGATATGVLAIQLACRSGLQVLTTCSENNRNFMYELGAHAVFDYHEPEVGKSIRSETEDSLELVLDTVSTVQSAAICADAISSAGGCYNALIDTRCPRADVDSHTTMAYDVVGETYRMGPSLVEGRRENLEFGAKWSRTVENLLHQHCITPHRHRIQRGGLAGILDGMKLLRAGAVRASKLVYPVEETLA